MLKPPHSWTAIKDLLAATGSRVIGIGRPTAQSIVELDKEIADLFAEGKKLTSRAEAENRDLSDAEVERLEAIYAEDDGEIEKLQAERDKAAKILAFKKKQARGMADLERNRYSGLVSKDENTDEEEDDDEEGDNEDDDEDEDQPKMKTSKSANRLAKASRRPKLVDASGKRMRVAMGGERLFTGARSDGFGDGRPRMGLGEMIRAHIRGEGSQMVTVGGSGGFMLPHLDSGIVQDNIRANTIFDKINGANIQMDGPETWVTQIKEDPTAYWQNELAVTKASAVSFGRLKLEAHTIRCIIPLSGEFTAYSTNGPQVVETTAYRAMAAAIDRAMLIGSGVGPEPLGVLNSAGVQTVNAVGYPVDDSKVSQGVGKIMQADFPGAAGELSLVMNPAIAGVWDNLRDSEGRPLMPTPWVGAMPKYVSSSLPSTLGDDDDESQAAILHGPSLLMGWGRQVEGRIYDAGVAVSESGERFEAPSQDVRFLVLQARVGIVVLRPSWQCVLSGILAVDPAP